MQSPDQAALIRTSIRTAPGIDPISRRSLGRRIWIGTTRFISFLGGAMKPAAVAWSLAGGPGGPAAIVLSNFMQRFGHPSVQNINSPVYSPRAAGSPYENAHMLNQVATQAVPNLSHAIDSVLEARTDAISNAIVDPGMFND